MSDDKKSISRRKFIHILGGSAAALGVAGCLPHVDGDWSSCSEEAFSLDPALVPRSHRVVEVFSEAAIDAAMNFDPAVVARMVEAGLTALTDTQAPGDAWRTILTGYEAGQRISIKANALNQSVPSSPPLLAALSASLTGGLGAPSADVFIWDRTQSELTMAGITDATMGVACRGTWRTANAPEGPGYEEEALCLSGRKIHLSRILTQEVDHLINVAVLKNHFAAGFTGCMKNHYGSFDNPWDFHEDTHLHIARLNAMPQVAGKNRLCVLDSLFGVVLGDTDKPADCAPKKILFSFDPVAIDQRGMDLRDQVRAEFTSNPAAPAEYLPVAEEMGLGSRNYELVSLTV